MCSRPVGTELKQLREHGISQREEMDPRWYKLPLCACERRLNADHFMQYLWETEVRQITRMLVYHAEVDGAP